MTDMNGQQPPDSATTDEAVATPDYLASPNAVFADEGVVWRDGKPPDFSKTGKAWVEGMAVSTYSSMDEAVVIDEMRPPGLVDLAVVTKHPLLVSAFDSSVPRTDHYNYVTMYFL